MTPYLIQRGHFKETKNEEVTGIDSLISLEYMGSSEFEWGALPQSLKEHIILNWKNYIVEKIDIQDLEKSYLYIICLKDDKDSVTEIVKKLFTESHPYHLKEWSNCYEYLTGGLIGRLEHTNFWWDINNHYMFCFGSNINRLILAMKRLHIKYKISDTEPDFGPQFQVVSDPDFQLKGLYWEDDSKVFKIMNNGKETVIVKRNILNISATSSSIDVKVFSKKANAERTIALTVPESKKRQALEKILQEWIEINERCKSN